MTNEIESSKRSPRFVEAFSIAFHSAKCSLITMSDGIAPTFEQASAVESQGWLIIFALDDDYTRASEISSYLIDVLELVVQV